MIILFIQQYSTFWNIYLQHLRNITLNVFIYFLFNKMHWNAWILKETANFWEIKILWKDKTSLENWFQQNIKKLHSYCQYNTQILQITNPWPLSKEVPLNFVNYILFMSRYSSEPSRFYCIWINPNGAGGTLCPHFFQMAISPRKKGTGGFKFLDFL